MHSDLVLDTVSVFVIVVCCWMIVCMCMVVARKVIIIEMCLLSMGLHNTSIKNN